MLKQIIEAQDLNVYKKMLTLFSDFVDSYPGTGMGKIYRTMLEAGLKCVPKDKKAQEILAYVLQDNSPKAIQNLINMQLAELPLPTRPIYKDGNSKMTAFWKKDDKIMSKVYDLLDLTDAGSAGDWVDEKGESVKLLDLGTEE
jgi:uncharacterized protein YlaN (UPF0358 family)